ncbi:hypothetical protein LCGC14_0909550 [marine sediment metagenome]|uniref:Uncharacterized protein n=1 Tax=marine sediment metagenome TaxID=412755 RepID=A0A0F9NYP7_9ZZZZ
MEIKGCNTGFIVEYKTSGIAVMNRIYFGKWIRLIEWLTENKKNILEVYDSDEE